MHHKQANETVPDQGDIDCESEPFFVAVEEDVAHDQEGGDEDHFSVETLEVLVVGEFLLELWGEF